MIPASYTIRLIDIKDDENIQNVLNNYEIYDNNYRETLNNKILDHYAYEEIGLETPYLFAHYLKVRLNEIMPKYNKLYESEMLKLDPLSNFNLKETFERENVSEGSSETLGNSESESESQTDTENSTTEKSKHVFQNTPQGQIATQTIDNYTYGTTQDLEKNENDSEQHKTNNITDTTSTSSSNSNSVSTTENYIKSLVGNKGR